MFLTVGHRGARAYETENTIESFGKAIEMGANAVEFDVRRSKDEHLVVSHDDNLKRVYGRDVALRGATLKELKELSGDRIATLEEALRFMRGKVGKILVELKEPGYEKKALDSIRKEKLSNQVIVVSFHEEALENVRKLDRKVETGLIYARFRNPVEAALRLSAQYLVPLYRFVHTKDIEKAHKNNIRVIVWTINTKEEARQYIAKGVDGIATDKPDIFKGMV
jgi:glycerophosphoryl diester phosphodiesterase